MPRESPLHLGHLRNMVLLTEMGAIMAPPMPAFYQHPQTLEDVITYSVCRMLDLLPLTEEMIDALPVHIPRWKDQPCASGENAKKTTFSPEIHDQPTKYGELPGT